jgi:hypothetical protein
LWCDARKWCENSIIVSKELTIWFQNITNECWGLRDSGLDLELQDPRRRENIMGIYSIDNTIIEREGAMGNHKGGRCELSRGGRSDGEIVR